MMGCKAIPASFIPNQHAIFFSTRLAKPRRARHILTLRSNKSDDKSSSEEEEGDVRQQELLARILMLETQKVRLTDYLDEKAAYLTQFAEEAKTEFDKIAEDTLKELDESNARKLEDLDSKMQAFEESAELNRQEIEKNDRNLAEFEDQVEKDRNQGLFFKSLGQQKKPEDVEQAKARAKEEIKKIEEITKQSAGSKTRRNAYLALIGLLVVGMAEAFISSSPDWRKIVALGAILVALIAQFTYEQKMLSETEKMEKERSEDKK